MIKFYRLDDVLKRRGMTHTQRAEKCGIATCTMSKLFNGKDILLSIVARICEVLEVQPSEIMEYVPVDGNRK